MAQLRIQDGSTFAKIFSDSTVGFAARDAVIRFLDAYGVVEHEKIREFAELFTAVESQDAVERVIASRPISGSPNDPSLDETSNETVCRRSTERRFVMN